MKPLVVICVSLISALIVVGLPRAEELAGDTSASPAPPSCCPKCGCRERLIPVCHSVCTTKKETKYRYCCKCEVVCIPDGGCCLTCGEHDGEKCGCAEANCSSTDGNCQCGKCNCLMKQEYKLVKVPYTVETPVRKCIVEWICPKCGCDCGCTDKSGAAQATPDTRPLPAPLKSASLTPTSTALRGN